MADTPELSRRFVALTGDWGRLTYLTRATLAAN
jgi:hypothetical protein